MGFSIKEIQYQNRYLLYLTEQELAGPWFRFKLKGEDVGEIPIILKNIEPTPIYKLINSRKGKAIDRITLDFDVKEYLKKLIEEGKMTPVKFKNKKSRIRLYIDIFLYPKVPYMNTFFTLKNNSDYNLIDFSMFFVFDFDINGLEGFDNDYSGYNAEDDIIYQYDDSGIHGGITTISKSTNYESELTREFTISQERLTLSNTLYKGKGEIMSALQIEFQTLKPQKSFQTALIISGGLSKEEFMENIRLGKKDAMKFLSQVNRSVKSKQRNTQEEKFIKLNKNKGSGCA